MTSSKLTEAEVVALIDTLDRAEPAATGWKSAYDRLNETLTEGHGRLRALRAVTAGPIAAMQIAILIRALLTGHWNSIFTEPWYFPTAFGLSLLWVIGEYVLRRVFPVLKHSSRVTALLKYYGAKTLPREAEAYL